jgi:nucleotide-binding universal stress UspA family protein
MAQIKKVLVAIDFGPASDAAVDEAAALASALDAKLTVLHVFETPSWAYPVLPYAPLVDIAAELEKAAHAEVSAIVRRLEGRVPSVEGVVRQGSAWRHINDVAQALGADIIVLGTHGRRGAPRALIGSVAEKVVRTSPVPVLTVHAPTLPAPS